MKEIINTYKKHRELIENYINTTVQKLQLKSIEKKSAQGF